MTLQDLINERPPKITATQDGKFDFGTAVKMTKRWSYYINTERFIQYMLGKDREVEMRA